MRQSGVLTEYDLKRGASVATLAYEYPPGFPVPEYAHGSDQLIYAIRGVLEVSAGQSVWLIPPHFALWIPARTFHRIRMPGCLDSDSLSAAWTGFRITPACAVLHNTPLLDLAYTAGYRQSSAFAGIFRRTLGSEPKAWMSIPDKLDRVRML